MLSLQTLFQDNIQGHASIHPETFSTKTNGFIFLNAQKHFILAQLEQHSDGDRPFGAT